MGDNKKAPTELSDDALEDAAGGLVINLSVGFRDDDDPRGPDTPEKPSREKGIFIPGRTY